jgi:L-alanine-DL-glutamate epimerase-like enolase superfamily enzyme
MPLNRRQILAAAAGTTAFFLSPGSRADAVEEVTESDLVEAANKPVLKRDLFKTPVIIESIECLTNGRDEFVRVRSRDGAEGISLTNSRGKYLFPILKQLIVPYFLGKDARDLEAHLWEVYRYRSNYKLQGLAFWSPVAWLEFAILDMLGRVANQPIGELLGNVIRREVPFYVASGRRDSSPEEEVDYLQSLLDETQAKAVKFRVGGRMSRNADALPGRTEKLIPLVRKTLGDGIDIHADSNSSYDPAQAIRVGRMLEEVNAVYFEEPCRFDELEPTRRVADALTIPVSGGEQEYSQWRFQWMIENRGVDIVQPDLHYYGGLIRSTRVARMADLADMPTTAHISGGFGFIYMLHFSSFIKNPGRYQEYKRGIERFGDWFDPPLQIHEGALRVPDGPGVGIQEIDRVLKNAVRVD